MNTDTIEEATEIKGEEQAAPSSTGTGESLHDRLKKITETKAPGTSTKTAEKSFWQQSDDDFEKEVKPTVIAAKEKTEPETPGATKAEAAKTDKIRHAEAEMAVGLLNVTLTGMFIPGQNWKLNRKIKKRFTEPEQELINSKLADAEITDIKDEEELKVKKRIDGIIKKYNKKVEAVPLSKDEKEQFHQACYNYMEITGKSLPPGMFLGLSAVQIFGNRIIDLATD